ncbi:hypothetical protein BC830DRAFT_1147428 [Chytriomyces sp. MP71]|nr:hypothetical protein BC830DRAFT_1147428 [Chytriomyces sp. MP71]
MAYPSKYENKIAFGKHHSECLSSVKVCGSASVSHSFATTPSLLLATLPFSMGEAENILVLHPCGTYCIPDWTSRARSSLIMTAACVVVVSIPMGVILYAYTAIYLQFAHANQILSVELNNSVPSLTKETKEARPTMDRSFREARKKERKLLIQSIAIVSVFVLGYSPYYIMILYQAISGTQVHASIDFAAAAIAQLEEFFNPVVVLLFDDAIRYRCLKLLQIKR